MSKKRTADTNVQTVRWIPIEESLPDDNLMVLIFSADKTFPVWLGYHDGDGWKIAEGNDVEPTHWMDLPEPPK